LKKKKFKKSQSKKTTYKKELSEDYDIAYDFSTKVYKKFPDIIKSVVLFGSVPKSETKKGSDIDIIIIIDDCTIQWDSELIAWYKTELSKLIESQKYKKELHINTVTLSVFWEEVKAGDPTVINIIRYGQALIDFGGFFDPLKVLLAKGKIRPTPEAIFAVLRRSPEHIARARLSIVSSIEHLYWSMVDSAHAALMANNQTPPSPEHIAEMLDIIFVKRGKLNKRYIQWFIELRNLTKEIGHGNIKYLKGEEIDDHINKVVEFEKVMRKLTSDLIEDEKIIKLKK